MSEKSNPEQDTIETLAAEARGDDITVEWKGSTYTIPRDTGKWPYGYILSMQKGLGAPAMEALLGPEQHARFLASNPTIADFNAFDVELGKAIGASTGESPASSD